MTDWRPRARRSAESAEEALEHARLMRSVAEELASRAPIADVLLRCSALLGALAPDDRIDIVAFDQASRDRHEAAGVDGVPIRFGEETLGAIRFARVADCDEERLALLQACALQIGARLFHERTIARSERYAEMAFTDGLTGIANRRRFDETLEREWAHASRERAPLSLLMIDLDYFKSFNDAYGHQAGDRVLQKIAHGLRNCLNRSCDIVARYGGEEFVVLLPGTHGAGAVTIAEAMRAAIAELAVVHAGSSLDRVSISIGAATDVPSAGAPADSLVGSADAALYRAKLGGRDRVFALDYETDVPSVRPRRMTTSSNLPLHLTRLIGRKREIAQIREAMERHRLVSVVGIGGSGKTRVAVGVAGELANRFRDGTWFVDLSGLSDPGLVGPAIASVLSGEVPVGDDGADALAKLLERRDALLVIDNCEHVVESVARTVAALIQGCPHLRILTTSREPLGLPGEYVYPLPILSLPAAGADPSVADVDAFDAVALFVERLTAASPDFALSDGALRAIVAICRAVDGLALAIELVASRAAIVGVEHVAHYLRDAQFVDGTDPTTPMRQRTMQATIAWSYERLSETERGLFARLSVFVGGFTQDAALAVCGGDAFDDGSGITALGALLRKSLITQEAEREARYRLLEPLRHFARDRLEASGETHRLMRRHAEYFEGLARSAEGTYRYAPSHEWVASIEPEIDNFRSALEWALGPGGDVTLGAALAAATTALFNDVSPSESVYWARRALDVLPPGRAPRSEAQLCLGLVVGSRNVPAAVLRAAGERAIVLFGEVDDRVGLAEALRGTAQVIGWYFRSERVLADELACRSIAIARELNDPVQLALSLRTRGLTIDIADFPAKRAVLLESLMLMREHGNDRHIGSMLTWISELEFSAGDRKRALAYGEEALLFAERSGSSEMRTTAGANLAHYACGLGDWETAGRVASDTLRLARRVRHDESFTCAVQALALCAAHAGEYDRAARLIGFCDGRFGVLHAQRQADQCEDILYRELLATLRERLDATACANAMREGAALNEEAVIALAEAS